MVVMGAHYWECLFYGLDEDFTDWILRTELFLLQTILSTVRGGSDDYMH